MNVLTPNREVYCFRWNVVCNGIRHAGPLPTVDKKGRSLELLNLVTRNRSYSNTRCESACKLGLPRCRSPHVTSLNFVTS
jgi:hypothetical protein